jgi:Mor family transcriptional regulator
MKRMLIFLFCACLTTSLMAQIKTVEEWKNYQKKVYLQVGTLNIGLMSYMTGKQYYLPVKTQKWLNCAVTFPIMGITIYKAFEYKSKKQKYEKQRI